MLLCKGESFALPASRIHQQCFDTGWSDGEFKSLLNLPTTRLWMNEQGLLLCSHVMDEMEILTVGVLPKFRHQGIATLLFQELLKYTQENQVKKIFLEVAQDNTPAINLYQKMGFLSIGRRKGYYHNGKTDAIMYQLSL